MIRRIALTRGLEATIDEDDYDLVKERTWHALAASNRKGWYAATNMPVGRCQYKIVRMHRLILGIKDGRLVDHRNRDGLDNRRDNLRIANHTQNRANAIGRGVSPYRGVTYEPKRNSARPWVANLWSGRRVKRLGCFETQEEAALAYNVAARDAFGEFAFINIPV